VGVEMIWVTLHDMGPENGPGVVSPTFDEVVARVMAAGFACVPRAGHVPHDVLAASLMCTSDSSDLFDLLEALIWSGAVFTLLAPRGDTLSLYMGCYALDVVEIEGAPEALLGAESDDDAYALLGEWVKTQPYTDLGPPVGYSASSVVGMLYYAWAGKIKRERFVVTAEQLDAFASAAAEFREGWPEWVAARRARRA